MHVRTIIHTYALVNRSELITHLHSHLLRCMFQIEKPRNGRLIRRLANYELRVCNDTVLIQRNCTDSCWRCETRRSKNEMQEHTKQTTDLLAQPRSKE